MGEDKIRVYQEIQLKKSAVYQNFTKDFINFTDAKGKSALHYAALKNDVALVKLLIERKAIPIARDHKSRVKQIVIFAETGGHE